MRETDPYLPILDGFLVKEFPGTATKKESVFEALCSEIFGTKQTRYGPFPSPEIQVTIRSVVDHYFVQNKAIQFLVPWGCSKQGEFELDILELFALKSLHCLSKRIREIYPPGVEITLRLEDATDIALFGESYRPKIEKYRDSMKQLVESLDYSDIWVRTECGDLMRETEFLDHVEMFKFLFEDYIRVSDIYGIEPAKDTIAFFSLQRMGWTGDIPLEQRKYYRQTYRTFYPNLSEQEITKLMATYFSCSLARNYLKGTGKPKSGKFIQINFSLPVPGLPETFSTNRMYYRTVPEKFTHKHKAPWIGRGYIKIEEGNCCKIKIADFNESIDLIPHTFSIGTVKVQAPYTVC